jgi:hypothetical protein
MSVLLVGCDCGYHFLDSWAGQSARFGASAQEQILPKEGQVRIAVLKHAALRLVLVLSFYRLPWAFTALRD